MYVCISEMNDSNEIRDKKEELGRACYCKELALLMKQSVIWKLTKGMIHERNNLKIKNFCCVKHNVKVMRRQATDWEKIFARDTSGVLSQIHKESLILNNGNTNNMINQWGKKIWTDCSQKRYTDGNEYMKRCSTSYVSGEMQI